MTDRLPAASCPLDDCEVAPGKTLPELCQIHHAILENAGRAIIATDLAGHVTYFNPAAQRMLGYSWSEIVGRPVTAILAVGDEVELRARRLSAELGHEVSPGFGIFVADRADRVPPPVVEWIFVRRDAAHFPVELAVSRLADNEGRALGYLGIASDISWRSRLEQDMQIAALAFKSQAAIMVTDAERRILRVNEAFSALTGYTAEESIGQTPAMLKSGRQDAAFYRQMWDSLNSTGHWQGEIWNRRKTGGIFPEWLTISEVRNDHGLLTHYVSTFSDISDLKLAESEIHNLAFFDPLTALPNRRLLLNRLGQARVAGKRSRQFGALLIIDLDHFKNLNDTLGHDIGDRLLVEVASRLRTCIREGDTAARQGGDEFIVMLEDLGSDVHSASVQAEAVAEKIRLSLNEPFLVGGDVQHFHSASIGVSLFCGHDKTTEALLKQADIALYKAKDAGRNSIRFFDSAMQTALEARASLESRLRRALSRDEFVLYVQAQVNGARQLIGAETLLRWQSPHGAMIGPADFIPLAEETGLIVPIGTWVLDTACARLRCWADNPATRRLYLSVNVSARQFRQPDFVDQVQAALARHGVRPQLLKLELTESLLLDNVENVIGKMQALRAIGVRFSLDDFGTGYASLSYLKRFPFEQLKVDRSFIRDIAVDPDDAAIVRAIIAMGNTLRLNVVAEGVETEEQHRYLAEHGCTCFQGYLFGRPMPFADFEKTLPAYGQPPETPDNWVI